MTPAHDDLEPGKLLRSDDCRNRHTLATCRAPHCDGLVILDNERSPQRYGYCSDTCLIESGGLERIIRQYQEARGWGHCVQCGEWRNLGRVHERGQMYTGLCSEECWEAAWSREGGKEPDALTRHVLRPPLDPECWDGVAGGQGRSAEDVRADAISWVAVTVGCVLGAIAWGLGAWLWRAMA